MYGPTAKVTNHNVRNSLLGVVKKSDDFVKDEAMAVASLLSLRQISQNVLRITAQRFEMIDAILYELFRVYFN